MSGSSVMAASVIRHDPEGAPVAPGLSVSPGANGVPQTTGTTQLGGSLSANLPEEKGANRITTHEAVEQGSDLVGLPHELPLDRRQDVLSFVDALEDFGDGNGGLEHSVDLDWWGGCGSGDALPRSGASALLQQR